MLMKKNKHIKLLIFIAICILITSINYCQPTYAIEDIMSAGKEFLSAGEDIGSTINEETLNNVSYSISSILLAIGIVVAVIVAMVLGIQFMIASADEKAKVKEALVPFIIGCIIVFGSFTIWKVIVNIGNNAEQSSQGVASVIKNNGSLYCDSCGDEVSSGELQNRKCYECGKKLTNIDEILN